MSAILGHERSAQFTHHYLEAFEPRKQSAPEVPLRLLLSVPKGLGRRGRQLSLRAFGFGVMVFDEGLRAIRIWVAAPTK